MRTTSRSWCSLAAEHGTLILSPHADDAALSLGGALLRQILPRPVTILTIFGRSNFATTARGVLAVSRLRAAEDAAFCSKVDARLLRWGLDDACLRHPHLAIHQLFGSCGDESTLRDALVSRLRTALADYGRGIVMAPMGWGGHVDHLLIRDAIERCGARRLVLYADQPYALDQELAGTTDVERAPLHLACCQSIARVKTAAASHYPSQPAAQRFAQRLASTLEGRTVELAVEA